MRAITGVLPGGLVRAHSRTEHEITRSYPELRRLAELVDEPVLLDGELVALDPAGRPSFQLLQQRMHVQTPTKRLVAAVPVQYVVFDLVHHAGCLDVWWESPVRTGWRVHVVAGLRWLWQDGCVDPHEGAENLDDGRLVARRVVGEPLQGVDAA